MRKDNFHFHFDPYDWLIQIENRQIDLENKHNLSIRNQKEMAIAYNDLGTKYNQLKKKLQEFETELWRAKNNQDVRQRFLKIMERPER